ncbi:WD repeat-containing and planar cell polarity effector protein fritz isoform X2 [Cylas formicarius]|uniref:WD repeat-containing and planar cell polarity effector protein fritz isoform X2 n=1 Tax=Cylas formicarius TaxID=197179 RepID=UPI002958AD7E|nr:WD repeat-containing and planar cell polarity effector protein fritz isoform X2 [Cylas formicarius]
MVTLLSKIHFWTTQEDVILKSTDWGAFKYYFKKDSGSSVYEQAKKQYCDQSGILYVPHNKRPEKLRDKLKEFEEHLIHNKVVCYSWDNNKLKLLLSTGLITVLTLNERTGDLLSISFDKQLSSKLQVNIICDGILFGSQVICVCNDGHVLGFGGPWRDGWVLEGSARRHLNFHNDWLVAWGKAGAEHPQPWSPLAKDHQRANLHLYGIGVREPELLAYKKTEGEPLLVVISKVSKGTIILVEQKVTQKGAVSIEVINFELIGNNLKRISVTSVPLQTQVSCSALSDSEDRLLIGCIDGSLALLDRNRGSTRTIKASFIPTLACWHQQSVLVAIANERGLIQYYDTALTCVKSQFLSEDCTPTALLDLSGYFSAQSRIVSVNWGPKDLIVSFEQGPLALITHVVGSLNFKTIGKRYLDSVDKAIKLLLSWEFNEKSFYILQKIVAYLLRRPLSDEIAQHLQNALGSFHSPALPLSYQVRHRFGHQVFSLTRRFFHQLVRASMFETAFLLAVDIGHHDLFMDLHYIAVKIGETEMAAAARAQASALLSRCSSEASNCSRSSCSQCSDGESCSSEEQFSKTNINLESGNHNGQYVSPITENILTTDFNHAIPTTYKTAEKDPVDRKSNDSHKFNFAPRATYVQSPRVPESFVKLSQVPTPSIPPLPFHSALGIPYIQQYAETMFSPHQINNTNYIGGTNCPTPATYAAFNASNSVKTSFTSINKLLPPPLPTVSIGSAYQSIASSSSSNLTNDLINLGGFPLLSGSSHPSVANATKKNQPKVKFSDTVTAFIVPEIKRPVRPPPPPHVTDPKRELAESLPLCHPNEDYLKDFTPVSQEGSERIEDDTPQPKIKVVHFGVV